ncbi:hypothetical protein BUALT_Bualt03G0040600 [Buddleja alternifolia]|uniref:Uncharacterized protein n=1 Tax=Buddleja alternifolia TaxID=168488 RepID=A0AAV6XR39_9LAMI|nr:hypothetical protein BUALT_Bualt03G0040600 [Buddleja alternifolia]
MILVVLDRLLHCGIEWQGNSSLAKKEVCMRMSSLPKKNHTVIPFPTQLFIFPQIKLDALCTRVHVVNTGEACFIYNPPGLAPSFGYAENGICLGLFILDFLVLLFIGTMPHCGIEWQGNSPLAKKESMHVHVLPAKGESHCYSFSHTIIFLIQIRLHAAYARLHFLNTGEACFIYIYIYHLVWHHYLDMLKEKAYAWDYSWRGNSSLAKKEVCMRMSSLPKKNHTVILFPTQLFIFPQIKLDALYTRVHVVNTGEACFIYNPPGLAPSFGYAENGICLGLFI